MNEILVIGYCKRAETERDINVPKYLKQIVVKFYPPFLDK